MRHGWRVCWPIKQTSDTIMSNKITVTIKTEYASGGRKSWWKHVKSIDSAQRGGYAFDGDFLNEGEVELQEGSLLLHVTNCGSVKNGYQDGALFAVQADGSLREIVAGLNWREQSVTLRKAAEAYLAEPAPAEAGLIQPEAAGPVAGEAQAVDWAVVGPKLAAALRSALPVVEDALADARIEAANAEGMPWEEAEVERRAAFSRQSDDIRAVLALLPSA
jgi:hypothetical protein